MPHIFPRRFLRTRDILDTRDMNEDVRPVQELLDGNLDRQNFDGPSLKALLKPRETAGVPSVAEGAYFNIHESMIESTYKMHTRIGPPGYSRKPPNFVKLDGSTLRHTFAPTNSGGGTYEDAYPYVVPNTGEWSVLKDASLTGPQQLTFTTGQSKIWLSAYVQYIWQGFYEWKPPWIPGRKKYMGEEVQGADGSPPTNFVDTHRSDYGSVRAERDVLNAFGPSEVWEHLVSDVKVNTTDNVLESDYQYAFPLNEIHPNNERKNPNLGGNHHISQGFYPCLMQFALRVDGKIVDDSITGKRLSYEESAHGLQAADSLVYDVGGKKYTVGQRSEQRKISFEDANTARSGQKLSSSRAVSCGPEVMPVRIGSVVDVAPGTHTVEIVARRLSRKRVKFQAGDFVGVFSRRLIAMDIPILPPRSEDGKAAVTVPNFESEDVVKAVNFNDVRHQLAGRENALQSSDVFRGSLPNTHLPSKVAFSQSVTLEPSFTISATTGGYRSEVNARPAARFPGFGSSKIDRVVVGRNDGWPMTTRGDGGAGFQSANGAGWYKLRNATSYLNIEPTDGQLTVLPNQKLLLLADVELRGIEPILSEWSSRMLASSSITQHRDFGSFICPERYLDLFALFAIGYKVGSIWTIASKFTPAMVNSFNWVNRGQGFKSESVGTTKIVDSIVTYGSLLGPASETSFKQTETIDRRGGQTTQNNLGVNVPLMQVIDYDDLGDSNAITEVAVFTCSEVPSNWTEGVRYRKDALGRILDFSWASSPEAGRDILQGTRVNYGNSRLTAIKLHK